MRPIGKNTEPSTPGEVSLFGREQTCRLPHYDQTTIGQKAALFLLAREAGLTLHVTYDAGEGIGIRSFDGKVTDAFLRREQDDFFHTGPETLVVMFSKQGGILSHQILSISAIDEQPSVNLKGASFKRATSRK